MRKFEKISFDQFKKDVSDDKELYDSYNIPVRKTKLSAGYDFESLIDYVLKPGEVKKIPLGIKAMFNSDEALLLIIRSSLGFKYNVRMCNQVGLVDADYYNNPSNEGHMWIQIQNQGEKDFVIKKHDCICQGVFIKYLTVDNEEEITVERVDGIGSTTKEEK